MSNDNDNDENIAREKRRKRLAAIAKKNGLKYNGTGADERSEKQNETPVSKPKPKKQPQKYKAVRDPNYQSRGLYDMMSQNPVLDKIARFWGLHLFQEIYLHMVVSLLLFVGVSFLVSNLVYSVSALLLGFNLFSGLLMGIVGIFLVNIPLTTRIIYYGMKFYRKVTGKF